MINSNYTNLLQHDFLEKEETNNLILDYQTNPCDKQKAIILEKIIRANFKYIYKLSYKFYSSRSRTSLTLDDYIQEGMIAAKRCVELFDVSKGYRFTTYYTGWHFSFCQRLYQNASRMIRRPTYQTELETKIRKTTAKFKLENNRTPNKRELAELLGVGITQIETCLGSIALGRTGSLDFKVSNVDNEEDSELIDFIASDNIELDELYQSEMQTQILDCLEILTEKERQAVILKNGLDNSTNKSLDAVGKAFNPPISRERVRQLLVTAYRKLRAHKKEELEELMQLYVA